MLAGKVDGNPVANPATGVYLPEGKHRVIVEARGFLPCDLEVAVAAGEMCTQALDLAAKPEKPKGNVEVSCVPWCPIAVDDKDTGRTSPAALTLPVGTHLLFLSNPRAGLARRVKVAVKEGATARQVVKLDA